MSAPAVEPSLPILARAFNDAATFMDRMGKQYALLPFRFISLDDNRYVLTNFAGQYTILRRDQLALFVGHQLPNTSPVYEELESKLFLMDMDSTVALDLLANQFRTKHSQLPELASLFIFVATLRCEHSCAYCQVSRQTQNKLAFDMSFSHADQAIEIMFESPSPRLKVEFQGGEPLLNFELISYVVQRVKNRNEDERKDIAFVIATNLALITDEMLSYCREHDIAISTSLDGPKELHNANRPRPGNDSYELAVKGIQRSRAILGADRVSALMTTTEKSLGCVDDIIDEYVRLGFSSIFLRSLSPFGFAIRTGAVDRYTSTQWLEFYKTGLEHILALNEDGLNFREDYAAIVLKKILTPYPTGYVDLQSPSGLGLGAIVFDYDGTIYGSDESRMLAATGDNTFRLGHVSTDRFRDVFRSSNYLSLLDKTMTEAMPMCSDCGFQPYCGSDPIYHYATQKDVVGHKSISGFCNKNMGIFRHLIEKLEDHPVHARILRSWIT